MSAAASLLVWLSGLGVKGAANMRHRAMRRSGSDLRLDATRCSNDVSEFRLALAWDNLHVAATRYAGPFLTSFLGPSAHAVSE